MTKLFANISWPKISSDCSLVCSLDLSLEAMLACCSKFCCGYNLRTGGSFVGYLSIIVYICLFVLSAIFLSRLIDRIDELEKSAPTRNFRSKASQKNFEVFVEDLKGENWGVKVKLNLKTFESLQRGLHRVYFISPFWSFLCVILDNWRETRE